MYPDIIRKDLVEEHWIEFLKFIKRDAEQRQQEEAEWREKHPVGSPGTSLGAQLVGAPTAYYPSIDGFWTWYIIEKLDGVIVQKDGDGLLKD